MPNKRRIGSEQRKAEPPFDLHSATDDIGRYATTTATIPTPTFPDALRNVVRMLRGRKRIVVIVGAGVSVSCGIPDFRSPDGLYATLDVEKLGLSCPEDLFDLEFFADNPVPFYIFARKLYFPLGDSTMVRPSDSHRLLAMLEHRKKCVQRIYTQNIDGLEVVAGVSNRKMVYAHGSLQWALCQKCSKRYDSNDFLTSIRIGAVPLCTAKQRKKNTHKRTSASGDPNTAASNNDTHNSSRIGACADGTDRPEYETNSKLDPMTTGIPAATDTTTLSVSDMTARPISSSSTTSPETSASHPPPPRQRSRRIRERNAAQTADQPTCERFAAATDGTCGGVLKPGITFFGETLNDKVRRSLEMDRDKVDGLIVMGTSLSVAPISKVIEYLPKNIPRILMNRTIIHPPSASGSPKSDNAKANNHRCDGRPGDGSDFRDDYVFDAYLLGNCDDISRALKRVMFGDEPDVESVEGTVLSTLLYSSDDDVGHSAGFNKDDWSSVTVPQERVLLFRGAQASASLPIPSWEMRPKKFCEVAYCDGCSERIHGTIQKCIDCFDYDLCAECYPSLRGVHGDGVHRFRTERAG